MAPNDPSLLVLSPLCRFSHTEGLDCDQQNVSEVMVCDY